MKKFPLIYGAPNSGKTTKAIELTRCQSFVYIDGSAPIEDIKKEIRHCLIREPKYIVVEGITPKNLNSDIFKSYITCDKIRVRNLDGSTKIINMPTFIFTTQYDIVEFDGIIERRFEPIQTIYSPPLTNL